MKSFLELFRGLFGGKGAGKIMAKCGHWTKKRDRVLAFGASVITTLPVDKDDSTDYCHRCLERMAVRCAWCAAK